MPRKAAVRGTVEGSCADGLTSWRDAARAPVSRGHARARRRGTPSWCFACRHGRGDTAETRMVTDRDRDVLEWIGRLGAAGAADVMRVSGWDAPPHTGSRRWWTRDCWPPSGCSTGSLRSMSPPARGLAWARLDRLDPCRVGVGSVRHYALCARLAVALERSETAYDGGARCALAAVPDPPRPQDALMPAVGVAPQRVPPPAAAALDDLDMARGACLRTRSWRLRSVFHVVFPTCLRQPGPRVLNGWETSDTA